MEGPTGRKSCGVSVSKNQRGFINACSKSNACLSTSVQKTNARPKSDACSLQRVSKKQCVFIINARSSMLSKRRYVCRKWTQMAQNGLKLTQNGRKWTHFYRHISKKHYYTQCYPQMCLFRCPIKNIVTSAQTKCTHIQMIAKWFIRI